MCLLVFHKRIGLLFNGRSVRLRDTTSECQDGGSKNSSMISLDDNARLPIDAGQERSVVKQESSRSTLKLTGPQHSRRSPNLQLWFRVERPVKQLDLGHRATPSHAKTQPPSRRFVLLRPTLTLLHMEACSARTSSERACAAIKANDRGRPPRSHSGSQTPSPSQAKTR